MWWRVLLSPPIFLFHTFSVSAQVFTIPSLSISACSPHRCCRRKLWWKGRVDPVHDLAGRLSVFSEWRRKEGENKVGLRGSRYSCYRVRKSTGGNWRGRCWCANPIPAKACGGQYWGLSARQPSTRLDLSQRVASWAVVSRLMVANVFKKTIWSFSVWGGGCFSSLQWDCNLVSRIRS